MANRPIYPDTIKSAGLDIVNADGTSLQTLLTAGSGGARVNYIGAVSDDTAAMVVELYVNDGTTDFLIGAASIPTLSGTDGSAPAVSILNSDDMPFIGEDLSIYLEGGHILKAAVAAAVTTAKKVTLLASYGDY